MVRSYGHAPWPSDMVRSVALVRRKRLEQGIVQQNLGPVNARVAHARVHMSVGWYQSGRQPVETGSFDNTAKIWTQPAAQSCEPPRSSAWSVRGVQSDGRRLVTGSYDRTVKIWTG